MRQFASIRTLAVIFATAICAFAQDAIKFEIPTDSNGAPAPAIILPKPDTVQKLGVMQGLPLNLALLSAKDTAGFETYSKRIALVGDSISATYRAIEATKTKSWSLMPKLEPKGEFEKQAEFDARQSKWNTDLAQMLERDTKPLTTRLTELEKAKAKIQENQASLYASIEIKSNPSAVSIWIGREEIGTTPAEYNLLIPGDVKISLRKEGYVQFDTLLKIAPSTKYKLNVALEEKSIFNQERELNFVKILNKDTTLQGYLTRIEKVNARKTEVSEEIKQILANFSNTYPALEPKKTGETDEQFNKRLDIWRKEGMRQYAELQKKDSTYNLKLNRTIEVLKDYIVADQSAVKSEIVPEAKLELGAYDAEAEVFELAAQNSESKKSPFIFKGKVNVPLNTAKALNRAAPGFAVGLHFINYPFETDSGSVNLAMSKLQLSMAGQDLKVEGAFGEIEQYKAIEGYPAWKLHADSLLSGKLKPQGLDYNYAMGKAAVKGAVVSESGGKSAGGSMGWRGWARIATYTLAAGCGAAAVVKHLSAEKHKDEAVKLENEVSLWDRTQNYTDEYKDLYKRHEAEADRVKSLQNQRLLYGVGAGTLVIAGTLTFLF